jgi:aldehyde oxidoreductase
MDELAEEMGIDPLELRYRNVYREGSTTPTGQAPEVYSLPEMIDILRPKYEAAVERAKANSTPEHKKGVGVSVGVYGSGLDGPDSAAAAVELTKDGVTVYTTWQDHGQGADMGALGTAHEALLPLELHPSEIKLVLNDTALAPNGGPSGGSRSQVMIGNAIVTACENLLEGLRKPEGGFRTYDEMVAEGLPLRYEGQWTMANATNCDENGQGAPFGVYMYGVFMAEVDVETKTGKTTVEKMTLVADIGKINNRLVVDGQIYGGLAQGIGLALSEDFEDIEKHDTMLGAGVPFVRDIPDDIEVIYVETPRPEGPFGAAGVGELPLTSPQVAVVNAINNATGARVRDLPARPEKVLAAMPAGK